LLWGIDRIFAIVWLLGVELGKILYSFSRAGEIVVVGAVEVFIVSANNIQAKKRTGNLPP
jgi:hypothetical protein